MSFTERLLAAQRTKGSLLCVGLDSDITKIPDSLRREFGDKAVFEFNRRIIDATKDLVCAYKLNLAFYEALGPPGIAMMEETIGYITDDIVVIADAKRGDIGNSSKAYARALFDRYGFDATTANPYLGLEELEPFFRYEDRGVLVLCRTSNPGAGEFQDLLCSGEPLYRRVARAAAQANGRFGNLGLVVGATWPKELKEIRNLAGEEMPILIPGVGKQAGDLEGAARYGSNRKGERAIINSSRGVIFASREEDFAEAARGAAQELCQKISRYRGGD